MYSISIHIKNGLLVLIKILIISFCFTWLEYMEFLLLEVFGCLWFWWKWIASGSCATIYSKGFQWLLRYLLIGVIYMIIIGSWIILGFSTFDIHGFSTFDIALNWEIFPLITALFVPCLHLNQYYTEISFSQKADYFIRRGSIKHLMFEEEKVLGNKWKGKCWI